MSTIKNLSNQIPSPLQPKQERDPKMLEAAQGFENQFIRQLISEMRKSVPKDELIPESMTEDIFREQLDGEYADKWVSQGGIGLADIIYDQLAQKLQKPADRVQSGEFLGLSPHTKDIKDIFEKADKNLFLAKKLQNGFDIRAKDPLAEKVNLRSPLPGLVLQAAALEDGRQMVLIKHDDGLVSQFLHTGRNTVKNNAHVDAGQVIAELPSSKEGESANVFFELRKAAKLE